MSRDHLLGIDPTPPELFPTPERLAELVAEANASPELLEQAAIQSGLPLSQAAALLSRVPPGWNDEDKLDQISVDHFFRAMRWERRKQNADWGAAHDDDHADAVWVAILARIIGDLANRATSHGFLDEPLTVNRRLVQIAAVALACAESMDRRRRRAEEDALTALICPYCEADWNGVTACPCGGDERDAEEGD